MMCPLTRRLWCRHIAPKFPKLLITSYNFVQAYCSQETTVRIAETNLNMIRQVTTPSKLETKGTGSIPARNAMIPVTAVSGRAAAGPVGPSAAAAKGRAGPAVGKAVHRKAAAGPAVGNVNSAASRGGPVCHVVPIRAAAGPAIGKVVSTHGPQMVMQRDTVLPGRAAAGPTEGNVGSVKGRVGSTPGRVIHAPRLPPGHVQAQQVCLSPCSHTHECLFTMMGDCLVLKARAHALGNHESLIDLFGSSDMRCMHEALLMYCLCPHLLCDP